MPPILIMPKIKYQQQNFRHDSLIMIEKIEAITNTYKQQGYDMTLRQVYYQLVSADVIENKKESYDNLGQLIGKARLAGLLDWNMIVDRNRGLRGTAHYGSPSERVKMAAHGYAIDKWANQKYRPEIWIEKEALAGIFSRVASELDIDYFSCKGYTSLSEMWRAANRMREYQRTGQIPVIIHIGDHDPSGIDMTRDIFDRLAMFKGGVEVERLALNINQVHKYKPPPNYAKVTDSRAKVYIQKFGRESWEVDALNPKILSDLIRDFVVTVRDETLWQQKVDEEKAHTTKLHAVADRFEKAAWFINGSYPKPFYCGCTGHYTCPEKVGVQGEISDDCENKCFQADCYQMRYEDESIIFCYDHWKQEREEIEKQQECATDYCANDVSPDSEYYCDECLLEQNEDISEIDE